MGSCQSRDHRVRMKVLLVLATVLLSVLAHPDYSDSFEEFKQKYNKEYETEDEETHRAGVWSDNLDMIRAHNIQADQGHHSFHLGENEFADMTSDEITAFFNGLKVESGGGELTTEVDVSDLPTEVDWRTKDIVTDVKDQKMCGSCWAFSATGSMEGQHALKTKKLVSLSEQNLVDCSMKEGNHGCFGGLPDYAFKYVKDNGGIDTEASYPYTAKTGKECLFKASTIGATLSSWTDIKKGSEADLAAAVAVVGPISVGIDAGHRGFQMYRRGIYYEKQCSSVHLDHGVLAVGYGAKKHDDNGKKDKFWIVKNSWGTTWGDKGYINMAKDVKNMCGIATAASFPV